MNNYDDCKYYFPQCCDCPHWIECYFPDAVQGEAN